MSSVRVACRLRPTQLAFVALLTMASLADAGLVIIRKPAGGTGGMPPPNLTGGGDIVTIFNRAADVWEQIFPDPTQTWTVEVTYGWGLSEGEGSGALSAQFILDTAGGSPRRVLSGQILFDRSGGTAWFADPDPSNNAAYAHVRPMGGDFVVPADPTGIAFLNTGIWFTDPVNPAAVDRIDLLTIAMHEIGHGLGMLASPPDFVCPTQFELTANQSPKYVGLEVFLDSLGIFEHLPSPSLMMPRNQANIRQFPATLDILSMAYIAEYNNPFWYPSLELIVRGVELPDDAKNSLLQKLDQSRQRLRLGQPTAARNLLRAFVSQVKLDPDGGLTEEQKDSLAAIGQTAIAGIGNVVGPCDDDDGTSNTTCQAVCGAFSAAVVPMAVTGFALMHGRVRRRGGRARSRRFGYLL